MEKASGESFARTTPKNGRGRRTRRIAERWLKQDAQARIRAPSEGSVSIGEQVAPVRR
jgi:hypothetical protein